MSMSAKLFMSGRSQAIRWPAKLRINASEVLIEPVGEAYLIKPRTPSQRDLGEWLRAFYAALEPLPDTFLAEHSDTASQTPVWS